MVNIYKNRKPSKKSIAIIKYTLNKNRCIFSDELINNCLKAIDKNTIPLDNSSN